MIGEKQRLPQKEPVREFPLTGPFSGAFLLVGMKGFEPSTPCPPAATSHTLISASLALRKNASRYPLAYSVEISLSCRIWYSSGEAPISSDSSSRILSLRSSTKALSIVHLLMDRVSYSYLYGIAESDISLTRNIKLFILIFKSFKLFWHSLWDSNNIFIYTNFIYILQCILFYIECMLFSKNKFFLFVECIL